MALIYKNQRKREQLAVKAGLTFALNRTGDLAGIVFGGRGNDYDELQYLRHQNGDAVTVNRFISDGKVKFSPANSSGSASNRADQQDHDFRINGSYP